MTYIPETKPKISTNNSTTATLTGDAVFTGASDDVTNYASISVSWDSDVTSADNGVVMEFSTDNVNWDRAIPVDSHSNSLQTNFGGIHRLTVIAQYFRVIYTNGTGAQAHFRLQTLYNPTNSMALVSRVEQQLNTTSDCMVTRAIVDINLDLARKQITGQETTFFFGQTSAVGIGVTWEDISPQGGDLNWQTSASKVEVFSTDADDNDTGVGLRSVEIHGLSDTGADQDEVIAMSGTSAVQSTLDYRRVTLMHNEEVGTYGGSHKGDITCRVTGGGDVLSLMEGAEGEEDITVQYGFGEAMAGWTSIPLGKVAYLTGGEITINTTASKTADVILYERDGLLTTSAPFVPRRVLWTAIEAQGKIPITFRSHIKMKALTDLWFRAKASAGGTKIQVQLEYYLVDENSSGA